MFRTFQEHWVDGLRSLDAGPGLSTCYRVLVQSLKRDASPGFPLCNIAKEKGMVLDIMPGDIKKSTEARFRLLCKEKIPDSYTAEDLVELGYCDPVKIFVKNEPHSREKVINKRFRLISSVSLIDEMCDRIAFMTQNHAERDMWESIPSACGMGFTPESVASIIDYAGDIERSGKLMATDVSGWDFSVTWEEYAREIEHRVLLAGAKGTTFEIYVYNLIRCRALSVFVLSDGESFAQVEPGIMKSGWYCTSSSNSRIRVDAHFLIGGSAAKANGDDCLADYVEDAEIKMLALGHISKDVPTSIDKFEFCSHIYTDGICYTTNAPKITYSLLGKGGTSVHKRQLYADYLDDLNNLPNKQYYIDLVKDSGWLPEADEEVIKHTLSLGSTLQTDQNGFRAKQNAERLHGSISKRRSVGCTVPPWLVVSNNMPQRKRTRQKKQPKQQQQPKQKVVYKDRPTPFTNAGGSTGSAIGSYLGIPGIGKGIGRFLGAGIGSIFGSGDYVMTGSPASYNVLQGSPPKFSSTHATNIVCHREYLQDVFGSPTFTNTTFPINPGQAGTFPWLAGIATNYQQYKLHGMIFEFKPLTTDFANAGVPGVVVMATNYNADAPAYTSKQQMENSEFAVSVKPTNNLMHMIECKTSETMDSIKNVRTAALTNLFDDLRLYDMGLFQFGIQGSSSSVLLGELWVTYCVEFFKPVLPTEIGGSVSTHIRRTTVANIAPMGLANYSPPAGDLIVTITGGTTLSWTATPGSVWFVTLSWVGLVATSPALIVTETGLNPISAFANNSSFNELAPNGAASTSMIFNRLYTCNAAVESVVSIVYSSATVPTTSTLDIIIVRCDATTF
jgi:hypothetical protein